MATADRGGPERDEAQELADRVFANPKVQKWVEEDAARNGTRDRTPLTREEYREHLQNED